MRTILSGYILREHVGPFLFAILVITFLFIMDLLIDYIDLFLGKGIALPVVLEVFFLSLGWMVALTVPMSVLVATVMAFGKLSADNEITAMKAAGVGIWQILAAPLLVTTLISAGLVQFNNHILPESNHRLASLLVNIHKKRPSLAIKQGMFNDMQGYTIRVEKLDGKTSAIEGVTIQRNTDDGKTETIVAEKGRIEFTRQGDVLTLFLRDGEIHAVDKASPAHYHRISFETHTIRITELGTELVRAEKNTRGDRELSASDMLARVHAYREEMDKHRQDREETIRSHLAARLSILDWQGPPAPDREEEPNPAAERDEARDLRNLGARLVAKEERITDRERQIDRYMVEVHKKYALPVACIVFILVGAPLGIQAHSGGPGVGIGLSIVFFVVYYLFLIGGEKLADRGYVPPAVAMWAANVLLGAIGIWMVARLMRETRHFRLPSFLRRKKDGDR
ncbi:MAG: LptF/LptG family permease [Candidatus Eisenbacteria bacterium]|nr:LptF/LptG family permease [Candidatus Eisenbacteria bacterium]